MAIAGEMGIVPGKRLGGSTSGARRAKSEVAGVEDHEGTAGLGL